MVTRISRTRKKRKNRPAFQTPRQEERRLLDYNRGFEAGYARGMEAGEQSFGKDFDGTSIIIPTYNRKDLLQQCIESIEAHTAPPYEIIVVDNGSTDGTADLLRLRRGPIRLAIHPQNLGFARAINTGLMMAKGRTIVLLNNDVLVTERWLDQMLNCLWQFPGAAAVGPVTNYISGEQQIEVPYEDVMHMPSFAAAYNVSDASKWRVTNRLVGFCLLLPRSTFEQVGYFDEGYEIGNFEDDDWAARLRLQAKTMVIAGDTFIHHYGSMTMKGLGEQGFAEVNSRNEKFYSKKWGDLQELYRQMSDLHASSVDPLKGRKAADFFPTHTWVQAGSGKMYWLEHGVRHPLDGAWTANDGQKQPPPRLSVVDLLQLPSGPARSLQDTRLSASVTAGRLQDGEVVHSTNGRMYQIDRGTRREIVSLYTCHSWGLQPRPELVSFEEIQDIPIGLPILPPPMLHSEDL